MTTLTVSHLHREGPWSPTDTQGVWDGERGSRFTSTFDLVESKYSMVKALHLIQCRPQAWFIVFHTRMIPDIPYFGPKSLTGFTQSLVSEVLFATYVHMFGEHCSQLRILQAVPSTQKKQAMGWRNSFGWLVWRTYLCPCASSTAL